MLSDELNHASIIDGIRLCKANKYRYKHMDMQDLEAKLQDAQVRGCAPTPKPPRVQAGPSPERFGFFPCRGHPFLLFGVDKSCSSVPLFPPAETPPAAGGHRWCLLHGR